MEELALEDRILRDPETRRAEEEGRVVLRRRRFGPARALLGRLAGVSRDWTVRLDPVGAMIWKALGPKGATCAELVALLRKELPDEPDVEGRLGLFLGTMRARGMIVVQQSPVQSR